MECKYFRTKRWNRWSLSAKRHQYVITIVQVNKSKILTTAVEVDQDYRRYIQARVSKSILSAPIPSQSLSSSDLAEKHTPTEPQLKCPQET